MRVRRVPSEDGGSAFELLDDDGEAIQVVSSFLRHLAARGYSPNTLSAYAHDLLHFFRFLSRRGIGYEDFSPAESLGLLGYLREATSSGTARRLVPVLVTTAGGQTATRLSPATVNHVLAAVSSLYEYLILSGRFGGGENPIRKVPDLETARVTGRHHPFMGRASRQRPLRRAVRVRMPIRLPRPLDDGQVAALFESLRKLRDKAMLLLMLQGGLRPGEVLNLRLEDIQYGRRRVIVRYRTDHPKGARTKSRTERVVDLHEPETLATLSEYVMRERPSDTQTPFVFLVGGKGNRRHEPLGYQALVKLFARHCEKLGIREPWVTPHALRHTHATRMWEGGMRELTLQKRLGHASPESTRLYTRVSDSVVVAEYRHALGLEVEP